MLFFDVRIITFLRVEIKKITLITPNKNPFKTIV